MTHLEREIEQIKNHILGLGAMVEEAFHRAVTSLEQRDTALAQEVIDADKEVDAREVEIEEECLKTMALHQPVAIDLRLLVTVLKMNDELERIADLAANIAEQGAALAGYAPVALPFDFVTMVDRTRWMLTHSLDALVNLDAKLAHQVWLADEEVDAIHRGMFATMKQTIREDPALLDPMLHAATVSRLLERIADHATSIAKDVIYMVEGEIVRHRVTQWAQGGRAARAGSDEPSPQG